MKPMLVIVENRSPRPIVAISLTWRVRNRDGGLIFRTNSIFPHVVCGDQAVARERLAILPGERHLVATGCVVENLDDIPEDDSWIEHFVREGDQTVEGADDVTIELDAVVFDDGQLIGPDEDGWLSALFGACVAAKQRWYRLILDGLRRGKSVDEAYAPVRAFQEETARRIMSGDPGGGLDRDVEALWRTQAAADVSRWRSRYSDPEIPTLLESVRLEPFLIRRA
jgi:hypothetical protein